MHKKIAFSSVSVQSQSRDLSFDFALGWRLRKYVCLCVVHAGNVCDRFIVHK